MGEWEIKVKENGMMATSNVMVCLNDRRHRAHSLDPNTPGLGRLGLSHKSEYRCILDERYWNSSRRRTYSERRATSGSTLDARRAGI
jgi:hypothetical protein